MPDIFLITSVINTGNAGWSYTSTRSIYTPQQRFEQTLHTIKSIRKHAPGDTIILLAEGSKLDSDMIIQMEDNVDIFLDLSDIKEVQDACIHSNKKGYGEIVKTRLALEYIETHNIAFDRFFKISGRYFLTDKFNSDNFSFTSYTFKISDDRTIGSTSVYSVPFNLIRNFYDAVLKTQEQYTTGGPQSLENILFLHCNPIKNIDVLGVSGYVAVFINEFYEA